MMHFLRYMFDVHHVKFLETPYFISLACYIISTVIGFKHLTLCQNVFFVVTCIGFARCLWKIRRAGYISEQTNERIIDRCGILVGNGGVRY
jgi:hypothetical protein